MLYKFIYEQWLAVERMNNIYVAIFLNETCARNLCIQK
jgi:hypothetical protein